MSIEYALFALTLVGVAVFHHRAFTVAAVGPVVALAYKLFFAGFDEGAGSLGLGRRLAHEWVTLANLTLLLTGFAMLAWRFKQSNLPHAAPHYLPRGWPGGLCLLALVFVLSAVLDNIAAAVIGGVVAKHVYRGKVGVGFVASIVAAAHAGGAGDTTTFRRCCSSRPTCRPRRPVRSSGRRRRDAAPLRPHRTASRFAPGDRLG